MKKQAGYIVAAALGVVALGGAVTAGYVQDQVDARRAERAAIAKPVSQRQAIERRRGRMAEVAIAGTTAQ